MTTHNSRPARTQPWEHEPTTTTPAPTTTTTAAPEPTTTEPAPTVTWETTPTPLVEALVELAPPASYAAPTLPHTGSEIAFIASIGGILLAAGIICAVYAARTRKADR